MKMKRLLTLLITIIFFGFGFAQEKEDLSPEEKAKREKNIQVGNPFKKFGYTPKIATLSKGKYLEFHDLDSIVPIGSVMYNVYTQKIVSFRNLDSLELSEATLKPEVISRWLSPDPLAEEFTSWSPYNFVYNNPIYFTDPDGRAPVPIEPVRPNVTGLLNYITTLSKQGVSSLSSLRTVYSNSTSAMYGNSSNSDQTRKQRYLYSKRWGWVDMKHFSAAADVTDYAFITAGMTLKRGESVEKNQLNKKSLSAYSYEDLTSNLLGIYFEEWLENDKTSFGEVVKLREELGIKKLSLFQTKVYKYLNELGFMNDPENAKDYKNIPMVEGGRGLKNYKYKPNTKTTEIPINNDGIDKKITDYFKKIKN
jgi:hypothetical protein